MRSTLLPVFLGIAAAGAFLLSGCKGLEKSNADLGLNKVDLQVIINDGHRIPDSGTYAWGPKLFKINYRKEVSIAELDDRVVGILTGELADKGFQPAKTADADYTLGYAVSFDYPIESSELNRAYGTDMQISFPSVGDNTELVYNRGVFILDVVDNASKTLVWRGAIMAQLDMDVPEDVKNARAVRVIDLLLAHFPRSAQPADTPLRK